MMTKESKANPETCLWSKKQPIWHTIEFVCVMQLNTQSHNDTIKINFLISNENKATS